MNGPIRLEPIALKKVWGGRRISTVLGRDLPPGPIGECWDVSARPEAPTVAFTGPEPGATPDRLLGAPFPLLVKVLDATTTLSVQVHPDEEACRDLPGAEPKHEAWVVLDVEPDAVLYRGFIDGVGPDDVEGALREGRIEEILHSFRPEVGDVVEVTPGTVHAIGAGCLLLEVQQPSDTTYRVWDWGRVGLDGKPRELHIDEALASFRYGDRGPDVVVPRTLEEGSDLLVDSPVLQVEQMPIADEVWAVLEPGRVHIVSNIGPNKIRLEGDLIPLRRGDSALYLPGDAVEVRLAEGEPTELLITSAEVRS